MGLSQEDRARRLSPGSDLWGKLDLAEHYYTTWHAFIKQLENDNLLDHQRRRILRQVQQAEEALLCLDSRERHATRERYQELLQSLREYYTRSGGRVPNVDDCLRFQGDRFERDLIEVCVSHNESSDALLASDPDNPDYDRFSQDSPYGCCTANMLLVAATLRLADILDFDRERTPDVLFHYLLPRNTSPSANVSVLEWGKHLTISNWDITANAIVYRGRCDDAVVHHAVVNFGSAIEEEIKCTRTIMDEKGKWPFILPDRVKIDIRSTGYRYLPYQFRLDEDRIYRLLMGNRIYDTPLAAVRELIQNAVDACKLRDALTRQKEPEALPNRERRIRIRYDASTSDHPYPLLTVADTGTGMDRHILENYFLRVGRSFYKSPEYLRIKAELGQRHLDIDVVSEFGIGFLSCFMLCDRLQVETMPWRARGRDARLRQLEIDGVGRLIQVRERPHEGFGGGTKVIMHLCRGGGGGAPPTWPQIRTYIGRVCQSIPYHLVLEYSGDDEVEAEVLEPLPLELPVPEHLSDAALRFDVDRPEDGLSGQIVLFRTNESAKVMRDLSRDQPIVVLDDEEFSGELSWTPQTNALLRGGFRVSDVPGLPRPYVHGQHPYARVELASPAGKMVRWETNLARTNVSAAGRVAEAIQNVWLTGLLNMVDELPVMGDFEFGRGCVPLAQCKWLQHYDAYAIYKLARNFWIGGGMKQETLEKWENGEVGRVSLGTYMYNSVHAGLLDLIMPRVCSLIYGAQGRRFLSKPCRLWRDELRNWHTFVDKPLSWGMYVEYEIAIARFMYYRYSGPCYINKEFEQHMSVMPYDVNRFFQLADNLLLNRYLGRQAHLTRSDGEILGWIRDNVPNCIVGDSFTSVDLREIALKP